MINKSYSEKLQNPLWQKKRLEILNRDQFTCKLCGDKETTLHIHHKEYIKGREPWDYEDDNFKTLCKDCHFIIEYYKKENYNIITCRKSIGNEDILFHIIFNDRRFGLVMKILTLKEGELTVDNIIFYSQLDYFKNAFESAEKLLKEN